MITRSNDVVVVDPSSGLLRLCAWCVPHARRIELHRLHRCSDGMCPDCQLQFLAAYPGDQPCQLEVTYPSGSQQTLSFATAFTRGLYVIALAAHPITVRLLSVVLVLLAIAAPASADPKFTGAGLTPYVIAIAGQGADLATTARNYRLGFTESNPIYGAHPTLGTIAAVKVGEGAAILALMKLFEKSGHPTAAKVLGYMGGIGGVIPAVINAKAGAR